jgi:recombinational DNA repair protein (RecF pathway)
LGRTKLREQDLILTMLAKGGEQVRAVAKGARKDLGRPKEPPQVNKALYMKTLGVSC